MSIEKDKEYQIKGKSEYFKNKYGVFNPIIKIEDTDKVVFGGSWGVQNGNPACMLFGMRMGLEGIQYPGKVYYGKIRINPNEKQGPSLGELVCEAELEEIK